MANMFLMPGMVFIGEEALELSMEELKKLGRKALIVTDRMMGELENVRRLTEVLDRIGTRYAVYDDVNTEPTDTMVEEGLRAYRMEGCDFLIGLGGGSPLDAMKAIGVMAANPGKISDYCGSPVLQELPPTVCIPTTAGTGSETTKSSVITNQKTSVKMLISDPKMMTTMAIVDPLFTITVPKDVTVATGIDALTHAVEAYTSKKACQLSDIQCISAVRRIFANIRTACINGTDKKARSQMAIASFEAGIALNNSSVTLVHGMSRPIGAMFHVPHGASNAMLLARSLDFVRPEAASRLHDLAVAIGAASPDAGIQEGAAAFVEETRRLLKSIGVKGIHEFNIDRDAFFLAMDKMAEDALASGSPGNSRREVRKEDIIDIYKGLWQDALAS